MQSTITMPAPPASRPNIVLILADDLGYGDCGCYNPQSKIPTPNIDALASQGVCFTDMHATSALCTPSRYSLLTGRYAWRTRLKERVLFNYEPPLIEPNRPTLASLLKGHGYRTACIGKWHLGLGYSEKPGERFELFDHPYPWPSEPPPREEESKINFTAPLTGGPCELGFDTFFGTSGCATAQPPYGFIEQDRFIEPPSARHGEAMPGARDGMMSPSWRHAEADPTFLERGVVFLEDAADGDEPFFMYLSASAPHEPCLPEVVPEIARGKSNAGARGDLVWYFDHMVGEVMQTLERTGHAPNTLVIVTSDNGALPGSEGKTYGHKSNGDWRGYKGGIWDGGHREPFIASWPGTIQPGSRCDALAGLHDLMATFAEILGNDPADPDAAGPDSVSLLPALRGESNHIRDTMIQHSALGVFCVRHGRWKLIVDCDNSGDPGRGIEGQAGTYPDPAMKGQLYDLADDPFERYNRIDDEPEIAARLRDQLTVAQTAE